MKAAEKIASLAVTACVAGIIIVGAVLSLGWWTV